MSERIGFLGIYGSAHNNQGIRGGLMVTNERGVPLELRVTVPVKPGKIQRAVYGQSLEAHVVAELVSVPLLGSLEHQPRFVLTNQMHCLDAESSAPVLMVRPADEMVVTGAYETLVLDSIGSGECLALAQGLGSESLALDRANTILLRTRQHFEPLEVFSRIDAALNVLAENDERFK